MTRVRAHAPGRVNLIGDHTDYAGGLALPMAIDLGTTIVGVRSGGTIRLHSEQFGSEARIEVPTHHPITSIEPAWSRHVAAVAIEMGCATGFEGTIDSTLPIGAGLSSSASLELATALALGFEGAPFDLAQLGQRAEFTAVGVPCGLLDQLSSALGREGHALLIDFESLAVEPVPMSDQLEILVVHSGVERTLAGSAYAERRTACERAASIIGGLRSCSIGDLDAIDDPGIRRRARHVITECGRVSEAVTALRSDDVATLGELMNASHRSLRDDFEVSTPAVDALVDHLAALPGVHGARVTGAGFGGCVVAACAPGAITDPETITGRGWIVRASGPARVELLDT